MGTYRTTLIPGAKLTITKVTQKKPQMQIACAVTGPAAIRQLDFKLKVPGAERFGENSNLSRDTTTGTGDQLTRTVTIMCYLFSPTGGEPPLPSALAVRLPEDMKRERIKFTLKALDLY